MQDKRKIKEIYNCISISSNEELYPLQKWYNQLIEKTIAEITVEDVLRMIIVAAGSVVTKSFRNSNIIIGGNPAHIINTWDKFSEKIKDNVITRKEMENCKERDSSFLISYADDLKNIIKNALVKSETRDWIYAGEEEEFKDMIDTLSKKIM